MKHPLNIKNVIYLTKEEKKELVWLIKDRIKELERDLSEVNLEKWLKEGFTGEEAARYYKARIKSLNQAIEHSRYMLEPS